jgi:sodium-dependent dicarboxylate transporter 2/3/5
VRGEPIQGGTSQLVGLVTGVVGFASILSIPLLAAASPLALRWAGGVLLVVGLGLVPGARTRRDLAVTATVLLTLAVALLLAPFLLEMPRAARSTLAAAVLMAAWWMTVAIPIPATSLLPLILFPVLGILPSGATAANFANNITFLFMGGFILALGVERWGLHRRIALHVVRTLGTQPSRMVLGFMLATAFLSMWISNTATTLMMLPIALAVIAAVHELSGGKRIGGFGPALLLGIAYSASIGGLATPIGTPPNMSFLRILEIFYTDAPTITFGRWTLAFLPLVAIFLPAAWLFLTRIAHRLSGAPIPAAGEVIRRELARLGKMGAAERRMLWVFGVTAVLWMTRGDLDLGAVHLPGWASLLERWVGEPFAGENLHDATVAICMAVLTFLIPGEPDSQGRRRALMDWPTAVKLPWGILLLFGGGFALAMAFKESGLSQYLGESYAGQVEGLSPLLLIAATCLLLTFLTEVTSNTATTEVMLPVLVGTAAAMGVNPLLLMVPATLSASCAFMLPIATPPNAIVFGSGELEMREMVRAGILLNLIGVVLITLVFYFVSSRLLGIDLTTVPVWARN